MRVRFYVMVVIALLMFCGTATAQTAQEQKGGVYYAYHAPKDTLTAVPEGFKPFYISHYGRHGSRWLPSDSRYEWVNAIKDLFLNKQKSIYSNEKYSAFCSIAGHSKLYDWIFDNYKKEDISVFSIMQLHKILFSFFSAPEFGGRIRQSNTLVVGAKFETLDWHDIPLKLSELDKDVKELDLNYNHYTKSEIIFKILKIHHELTIIHPFPDGNGRVSRAFMNIQLLRYGLLPFYIDINIKNKYYDSLYTADITGNVNELMCIAVQKMMNTHVALQSKY